MEPISAERLRDVIITLRNQYVEEGKVKTFEEINSGLCVEFAEEVQSHFGWIEDRFFIVNSDEFKVLDPDGEITGHEDWDAAEVEKWGLKPPLPWEEMNKIDFGYHVWLGRVFKPQANQIMEEASFKNATKVHVNLSNRVASLRLCFSLLNRHSTRCRSLNNHQSVER
jgi:hypothetical protein